MSNFWNKKIKDKRAIAERLNVEEEKINELKDGKWYNDNEIKKEEDENYYNLDLETLDVDKELNNYQKNDDIQIELNNCPSNEDILEEDNNNFSNNYIDFLIKENRDILRENKKLKLQIERYEKLIDRL